VREKKKATGILKVNFRNCLKLNILKAYSLKAEKTKFPE